MRDKLALEADLWYNKLMKKVVSGSATNTPDRANLLRRLAMSIIQHQLFSDKPQKTCTGPCGRTLPMTSEYWHRNKTTPDGFQYRCIQCRSKAKPRHIAPDGYKTCSQCKQDLPATPENFIVRKAYRGRKERLESHCKECKAKADKEYGMAHRDERKEYRESRKEEDKLYMAEWHQRNREHEQAYRITYTQSRRTHILNWRKTYYPIYSKTERGLITIRVSSQNRRARKRNAVGTHTTEELYQQLQRQKNKCHYCDVKLKNDRASWHADHVIPLARGGSNSIDNIVIACAECNLSKSNKMPHEWERGGRLL